MADVDLPIGGYDIVGLKSVNYATLAEENKMLKKGNEKSFQIKDEKLYTINEVAGICGVGRTTLIRMEECGFDAPRKVDEKTGYRYYDVVNIHKIMQYQMYQKLGLSKKDMTAYVNGDMGKEEFLGMLKERYTIAKRCMDEFEARFTERESVSYSYVDLPAVDCYCFPCEISNPKEQIEYNYLELQKMYDAGYKPFPATPMFSVLPEIGAVFDSSSLNPFKSTMCVVIHPEPAPDPSRVVHFSEAQAFSLLYHGNDTWMMNNGGKMLWEEMQKRNIEPKGPLYGICVVGPYFDTNIDPNDYVFRWAIPV